MALFRRAAPAPWPPGSPAAPPPWPPVPPGAGGPTWPPPQPGAVPDDSPQGLRTVLTALNRTINSSAGRLPIPSVVAARRVTDLVAEVLRTADLRPLDVYATLSIKGILTDYLPTTIRSFLAVDESLIDTPRPSGRTPAQSLAEQLEALESSASAVLSAVHQQDADALMTQGNFLSTKFSRSDLDL